MTFRYAFSLAALAALLADGWECCAYWGNDDGGPSRWSSWLLRRNDD